MIRMVCCVFAFSVLMGTQVALAQYDGATSVPEKYVTGFQSITEGDSRELLTRLIAEDFSGRGTGQEGYLNAARWVAGNLEAWGFQPAGPDGSWYQNVPFIRVSVDAEKTALRLGDEILSDGDQFGIAHFVGTFDKQLPVTFAAIPNSRKQPEIKEGQFAGQLLVIRGRLEGNEAFLSRGNPECVLIAVDEARIRTESVSRLEQTPLPTPAAKISLTAASKLAERCGVQGELFTGESPDQPIFVASSVVAHASVSVVRESMDVPNVVGWYPGSDETVNDEYIGIGAHLDHLGVQRDQVFPGADDNGSGSAAILQMAKAIHLGDTKPRRSVLFMAFCAEERGLLGSKFYCENPVRPLDKMICMLNIDMIGRNEETADEAASENENTIHLVGSQLASEEMHETVMDANKYVNFVFEYDEEKRVAMRSDQASFAAKGVPVTFLFGGFNPHYHKTTDTLDGINFGKIANAARLNYLTLMFASEHGHFKKKPAVAAE
ncbi:MAG: M28 family peptidase [Planctomycetaceae bacterium]|nr:M28 family peptidase [Planctomycetaceae bacterium]